MRLIIFILVFYFAQIFCIKSQELTKIKWHDKDYTMFHSFYIKPFKLSSESLSFSLSSTKKATNLKYHPAPLPFFCAMEEKSKNKFHIILKLRAGNDESYMKMIKSTEK